MVRHKVKTHCSINNLNVAFHFNAWQCVFMTCGSTVRQKKKQQLATFHLCSTVWPSLYLSNLYSLSDPHSFLISSLHRIPQIPNSFSHSSLSTTRPIEPQFLPQVTNVQLLHITLLQDSETLWLCAFKASVRESYAKVLVKKGRQRDALQSQRQAGMSWASLGRERNVIIPPATP